MKIKNTDFLFAENPNPMWIFDPADLSIHQVNEAACDLYGYSEEEFLALTIADLRPEEEIPKLMEEISKGIETFSNAGVWKHRKKSGEILFVRILSYPITRAGRQFELISAHDVTNKIQYREELHKVLENSLDGIMLTSPDGRIHRVNKAACQMLDMTEEQIKDLGRDGVVHNDEKLQKALSSRSQTGEFSGELTLIHSSGRKIPVDLTTSVYTDPQGRVRTSIIFRDITQRKQTEQKLKDIVEHSTNLFYRHDINHELTYVSPQSEELLGCSPEEAKQQWTDFITDHPINQEGLLQTQKAIETGETQRPYQLQLQKATGEIIWVRVHEAPIVEDGQTVAIVGSLTDITRQKQYDQQLQESLERYHYATKATQDAIYEWDITNDQLYLGEGFKEIFGHDIFNESFSLEQYTQFVHPEDHPEVQKSLDKALIDPTQNYWSNQYRFRKSDGKYAHVVENGYIVRNREGIAIRMIGALRDITKERELKQLLDQAYAIGGIGVWELDLKSDSLYWSPITKELHEVEPDFEPNLETAIHFYKEGESRTTIQKAVNKAIDKGSAWDVELQIVTAKGNSRWVRSKGEPEMVEGKCHRIYGIFQDVHDRKEAQIELEQAFKEKEDILESIGDGFFSVKRDWEVTYWNRTAERLLHIPKHAILGNNLWDVFEDATDLRTYTNLHRVMYERATAHFEDYYPPTDRWFDVNAYPSEEGITVYFKDITQQKKKDLQLQESLKEKDTLLAEIHHRVKNNLAVVSSLMQLQAFQEEDESIKQKLSAGVSRIKTIANIHEILYKANSFSRLNLDENIRRLVGEIEQTYQLPIQPKINFDLQKVDLNINQAIPASLIANEVVTNVFKHALDGKNQGKIWIKMTETKHTVTLQIMDNGKGLPEDFSAADNTSSLGLQLIDILTQQLQGNNKFESIDGKTSFTLTFEKKETKGSSSALL